jgi:hypothetical protein
MLAILILLAGISHADSSDDKVQGGRIGLGCTSETAPQLQEAVLKAGALADQCLRRDALNPELADRLKSLRDSNVTTFHCKYNLSTKMAAGTWRGPYGPEIGVDQEEAPPGRMSLPDLQEIDLDVFHELIHAVDKDNAMIGFEPGLHNTVYGFPDVPYSCEFACSGTLRPGSTARGTIGAYELLTDTKLPELKRWPCKPGTPATDCSFVRKYAAVCQNSAPFSVDPKKLQRFKETYCVRNTLANCETGRCAYDWRTECAADRCPPLLNAYIEDIRSKGPSSWQSKASMMFDLAIMIEQVRKEHDGVAEPSKDPKLANELLDVRYATAKCANPNP